MEFALGGERALARDDGEPGGLLKRSERSKKQE
jgi:hypothetical protein